MAGSIKLCENYSAPNGFLEWIPIPQGGLYSTGPAAIYITATHVTDSVIIVQQSHNGSDAVSMVNRAGSAIQHTVTSSATTFLDEIDTNYTHLRVRHASGASVVTVEVVF